MAPSPVTPLGQQNRLSSSVPLADADLGLGNANWTKALQSQSDWIWSGNLNPVAFPNNLGRYFLQIPAIFEQQLNYSASLIFDEPSYRNGIQVSGFIERPIRELVISLIAQRRRAWYTMTHHAVLGTLTARKHGIADKVFADKLVHLTEHQRYPDTFSPVEREILKFADAFATNPKEWGDKDCGALKAVLLQDNERRYPMEGAWVQALDASRAARRGAIARSANGSAVSAAARQAAKEASTVLPRDLNDRLVNAQLVELAFLCLQFVALADVFSALSIPDESFLPAVMMDLLSPEVIARLNELNALGGDGLSPLIPPPVDLPLPDIVAERVRVAPAHLKGSRIPLASYEIDKAQAERDKGVAVGGVQTGAWGWSFGSYFPGGLVYALMHHPELARFEPPYSLPLLFNEDEWRNGTQTGGFVNRRLKEVAYLKIYTTTRSRYGLEHHTMFLYNIYLDEYGVGRPPRPTLSEAETTAARAAALRHADNVVIYANSPAQAPAGTYTSLELAAMDWIGQVVANAHHAHRFEARLRQELDAENRREVADGLRVLDTSPGIGVEAAYRRLLDHQIAELAMLTGHMDGLGRAMTMLHLESEEQTRVEDGYLTNRPGLFLVYDFLGIGSAARTANELRLNPRLLEKLRQSNTSPVSAETAAETGEF